MVPDSVIHRKPVSDPHVQTRAALLDRGELLDHAAFQRARPQAGSLVLDPARISLAPHLVHSDIHVGNKMSPGSRPRGYRLLQLPVLIFPPVEHASPVVVDPIAWVYSVSLNFHSLSQKKVYPFLFSDAQVVPLESLHLSAPRGACTAHRPIEPRCGAACTRPRPRPGARTA